jgi:hypothetical protein
MGNAGLPQPALHPFQPQPQPVQPEPVRPSHVPTQQMPAQPMRRFPTPSDTISANYARDTRVADDDLSLGQRARRSTDAPWLRALVGLGLVALGGVVGYLSAGPATSSITLETSPNDSHVEIDGQVIAGVSPYAREGLLRGSHTLSVRHEGYQDHRDTFTISAGDAGRLPAVKLEKLPAAVPHRPEPAPSRVSVATAASPSLVVTLPQATQPLDHPDDPYTIRLELRGLSPAGAAAAGNAPVRSAVVTRAPKAASSPRKDDDAAAAAEAARAKRIERCEQTWDEAVAAEPGPPPPNKPNERRSVRDTAASESAFKQAERCKWVWKRGMNADDVATSTTGTLRVNSRPWSEVHVDGELVGNTPLSEIALRPGTHTIELVNPAMKLTKSLSVFVPRGRIVTKVENLLDDE